MTRNNLLWFSGGAVAIVAVCCVGFLFFSVLGNVARSPDTIPPPGESATSVSLAPQSQVPIPTVTAFPTPRPPLAVPAATPVDLQSQDLVTYANQLAPVLEAILEIAGRDSEILQAAEQDDTLLCDGRLAADNLAMQAHLMQIDGIPPPANGTQIHALLVRSGDAWEEALENVGLFCDTGNALYKLPAALKFWEAAALFQEAANRFWLLLIAEGLEAYVNR